MKNLFRMMGISGSDAAITKQGSLLSKLQRIKTAGMLLLILMVGFGMLACDDGGGSSGSGKYSGKDVLGNTYSLLVGSDARAADKGDNFKMVVNTRGGTKNISGSVTNINADGTLTLKSGASTFTAIVDEEGNIGTVYSNNLAQSGFAPRTFDTIYLRANRWGKETDTVYGENWGSGGVVLVKDFPANVSALSSATDRYTLTISGTSDTNIDHFRVDIQGLTKDNKWVWLGKTNKAQNMEVKANVPFTKTVTIDLMEDFTGKGISPNFMSYKEIVLEVNNLIHTTNTQYADLTEDYGRIPSDVQNWDIMATISDFNIVLKDKNKKDLTGNMGNYTYALKDDGISPEYRMVMWKLNSTNITNAKKAGAKLVIGFKSGAEIENNGAALLFAWQDPVRGLWWQDGKTFSGNESDDNWVTMHYRTQHEAVWDKSAGTMTIPLSSFIHDSKFADASEVNFLIMCNWWGSSGDSFSIDELEIVSASIN